jgi:hypothetical protein
MTLDPDLYVPPETEWQGDIRRIREDQTRRLWLTGIGGAAILLGFLILGFWLLVIVGDRSDDRGRIQRLEETSEEGSNDIDRLADGLEAVRAQVEELGQVPVAPPAEDLIAESGVIELNDPDPNDPEIQDLEVDDPDPFDDPDPNDPEIQDPEIQDREIQDPEIQDSGPMCPAGYEPREVRIPSVSNTAIFLVCAR